MTALERLIANGNAVIGFLKTFSSSTAQDVQFEWINDDDSTEVITFANIKKFQESVNIFRNEDGAFVDGEGNSIAIDAQTLGGKTAEQINTSTALKFEKILDIDTGGFPERWHWGVTDKSELVFWGRNASSYVGGDTGASEDNMGYHLVPQPAAKKGVAIKQIFATTWAGYVLYEDGDLYGMGHSGYGEMGQGNTAHQYSLIHILSDVDSVATSSHGYHQDQNTLFAIKNDNSVWSWGRNSYGQCGNGNTTNQYSPGERVIEGLLANEKVIKAYVCDTNVISTYLLTDQGRVFSCGWNGDGGALGLGDTTSRSRFELVSGVLDGKHVVQLSVAGGTRSSTTAYYRHSVVALTDEGELYGWGYNGNADLGLGNTSNHSTPQKINVTPDVGQFTKIFSSLSSWTSRFVLSDSGELWAWGRNYYGCLGADGSTLSIPFKVRLYNEDGTENNAKVVDALITTSGIYGYHHTSFVRTEDGKLFSSGYSGKGQLGRNRTSNDSRFREVRFPYANQIKQWSFGGHSSAYSLWVLLTDGRVFSWGDNNYQQAVTSRSTENVRVPQLTIQ